MNPGNLREASKQNKLKILQDLRDFWKKNRGKHSGGSTFTCACPYFNGYRNPDMLLQSITVHGGEKWEWKDFWSRTLQDLLKDLNRYDETTIPHEKKYKNYLNILDDFDDEQLIEKVDEKCYQRLEERLDSSIEFLMQALLPNNKESPLWQPGNRKIIVNKLLDFVRSRFCDPALIVGVDQPNVPILYQLLFQSGMLKEFGFADEKIPLTVKYVLDYKGEWLKGGKYFDEESGYTSRLEIYDHFADLPAEILDRKVWHLQGGCLRNSGLDQNPKARKICLAENPYLEIQYFVDGLPKERLCEILEYVVKVRSLSQLAASACKKTMNENSKYKLMIVYTLCNYDLPKSLLDTLNLSPEDHALLTKEKLQESGMSLLAPSEEYLDGAQFDK